LLASAPPNETPAALDEPDSPPFGKLMLRNDEIKAAGLDKLLSAPANLPAVDNAPPTVLAAVFNIDPKSAIDFSFCLLFS
jgi:hypothetical protein